MVLCKMERINTAISLGSRSRYCDMFQPSSIRDQYVPTETRLILGAIALVTFIKGFVMNYQFLLREKNAQMGGLSTVEGIVYVFGPIIIEPFVLFGVVYYLGSRTDRPPSLLVVLPGLIGVVLLGIFGGQFVGNSLFPTGWTPLYQATQQALFQPNVLTYSVWRDLLMPPVRAILTALAALALVKSVSE